MCRPPSPSLFPYTTLFRSFAGREVRIRISSPKRSTQANRYYWKAIIDKIRQGMIEAGIGFFEDVTPDGEVVIRPVMADRKSTRLNSSHVAISYAVFCLKKK